MRRILVLISLILFTGCVGIGVVHNKEIIKKCNEDQSKKLKQNENKEVKYINDAYAFRGIVPMIIIGFPILLPIGTNYSYIKFENKQCIYVKEYTNWSGYMCGLLNENGKWGCQFLGTP